MTKTKKETSKTLASLAGKVLQDDKSSQKAKKLAGSVLSQRETKKKK